MTPEEIYSAARNAGLSAAQAITPETMLVTQQVTPFDDQSRVRQAWIAPEGPCGRAWINIHPANSKFARWMLANRLARRNHTAGGITVHVSEFNQSVQRKAAYADAFATTLRLHGINAYADSKED